MMRKAFVSLLIVIFLLATAGTVLAAADNPNPPKTQLTHKMLSGKGHLKDDVAQILGMDPNALRQELKSGKSIKDVAAAKGIDENTLKTQLIAKLNERLDKAVADKKLDPEKADAIRTRATQNISKIIEKKWDPQSENRKGHKDGFGHKAKLFRGVKDQIRKSLNMSKEELRTEIQSGKSIAQIAAEKGISKQELISKISATIEQNMNAMIKEQKLNEEKAAKIKEKLPQIIEKMLEHQHQAKSFKES